MQSPWCQTGELRKPINYGTMTAVADEKGPAFGESLENPRI